MQDHAKHHWGVISLTPMSTRTSSGSSKCFIDEFPDVTEIFFIRPSYEWETAATTPAQKNAVKNAAWESF
ncbi:Uu.00g123640.m01.CDS01 [Anthostomella pinea]|uniref:Uu.00g123640.m01.CDS01 n=1 Tax=Anthostomella pinea TaxID=933095 RepID=A0AAI8VHF5_9PEZI|nr:Uu.00g123640.m01.CDS01 [Anthostomella pinea]